jgi:quinol monooxygenase YgiN
MRTPLLLAACLALALASTAPAKDKDEEPEIITRLKKAKIDGPFALIVRFQVKEGQQKAMLAAAKPCVKASRKEKGCLSYELHQDIADPTKFVFYERWKSPRDLAAHLKAEHTKKLITAVGKLVEGKPEFGAYRLTDKD